MSRLNNKWKRSLLALVAVIALVAGQIPIAAFGEAAQQAALEANDLPMADLPADDLQVDDVDAQSADDPEAPAAEDQDDEVPEQEAAEPEENTTGVDIELAIQSDGSGETPLSVAAASCQLYVGRNVAGGRMKVETPTASNEGINLQFGVHEGDEITLTALPASGYKFVGWYLGIPGSPNWSYVEGSGPYSTDKVYTFTMGDSDQKICAVYEEAAPCTLYVGRNGDHGSIKADGVQTSSGWVSTGKYPLYEGNDITLHANAPAGYVFVGWYPGTLSNDTVTGYDESAQPYSTNADYSFTMGTEDRQICAVFESATAADSVNLSVTTDANGVLYIDDSNYGSSFTGTYPQGRQVKLEAQPKYSDYEFDHWEVTKGDATQATTVTDNPYTLTLNESASAVAVFRHVPNLGIKVSEGGKVTGSISYGDESIPLELETEGNYNTPTGASVTMTATASDNYVFVGWYEGVMSSTTGFVDGYNPDNCYSTDATYSYTVSGDKCVYALFKAKTHEVTFNAHGGTPTPATQTVSHGAKATKPADPTKTGFSFLGWFEKEGSKLTRSEVYSGGFKFADTAIEDDITLHGVWYADFEGGALDVTDPDNPVIAKGGKVSWTSSYQCSTNPISQWYSYSTIQGSQVVCTAHPADGYVFVGWSTTRSMNGLIPGATNEEYTFTFDGYTKLYALFSNNAWTVSFDANGGRGIMDSVSVVKGAQYTLPECDFSAPNLMEQDFDCWEVNGQRKAPGDTVTITADTTVKALWKDIVHLFVFPSTESADTLKSVALDGKPLEYDTVGYFAELEPGCSPVVSVTPNAGYAVTSIEPLESTPVEVAYAYDSSTGGATASMTGLAKGTYVLVVETSKAATVTFDTKGGTPVPASQVVPVGGYATEPASADNPSKEHFSFSHWYAGDDPTSYFYFGQTAIEADTVINAAWSAGVAVEAHNMTDPESEEAVGAITLDGEELPYPLGAKTAYEMTGITLKATPVDGYRFVGWAKQTDSGYTVVYGEPEYTFIFGPSVESIYGFRSFEDLPGWGDFLNVHALFEAIPIEYFVTEGDGSSWTVGSADSLRFRFTRSVDDESTFDAHYAGFKVDGDKDVPEGQYTAERGSVVITLSADYLKTLAVGDHTITASFNEDGEVMTATATFAVKAAPEQGTATKADTKRTSPKTGDGLGTTVSVLAVTAVLACAVLAFSRRRCRR